MELSRRGALGGLGAACALGAVGFVGASTVDDSSSDEESADEPEARYVDADPEAPFLARVVDGGSEADLFTAADLNRVEGVHPNDGEYLVVIELTASGREGLREGLETTGADEDPEPFEIVMTLEGDPVREVDLDRPTVESLVDTDFEGVITLPFEDESLAGQVYEALAAE